MTRFRENTNTESMECTGVHFNRNMGVTKLPQNQMNQTKPNQMNLTSSNYCREISIQAALQFVQHKTTPAFRFK